MPRRRLVLMASGLLAGSVLAAPAAGEEYQCQRGDALRRIEVRFAEDADRLPCQVLYWRDATGSRQPSVPWNAQNQLEFCTRKAREMVEQLQTSGWACERDGPLSEDAAQLETAGPPEGSSRAPAAAAPGRGTNSENRSLQPADASLQAALERDLRRLAELSGAASWQYDPSSLTMGDLNGDGREDGAVLLNYRDAEGRLSHHLLAYLADGAGFRPVARINIEAYYQNFAAVAIDAIADGGIELLLQTPRAGDPACCPSGRRHATFELEAGQLVLAEESESGA